jgi:hypothetical protein
VKRMRPAGRAIAACAALVVAVPVAAIVSTGTAWATSPGGSCAWTAPPVLKATFGLSFQATSVHPTVPGGSNTCVYEGKKSNYQLTITASYYVYGTTSAQAIYANASQVNPNSKATVEQLNIGSGTPKDPDPFGSYNGKPSKTAVLFIDRSFIHGYVYIWNEVLDVADGTNMFAVSAAAQLLPGPFGPIKANAFLVATQAEGLARHIAPSFYYDAD